MISARNINLSFGSSLILRDINLELDTGQIATVIGPSGSGKTTLLRALCLLDRPDSGSIIVDELRYDFPRKKLRTDEGPWPIITVVFQDLYLWPHLTLRANILLPFKVKGKSAIGSIRVEFEELIETLDISKCIDRRPHEVSGGEKQRAAIARAILLNPKYLLLDEITSALDIEQVVVILDLLAGLKDRNLGMIVVSHHIEFTKRVSDHVYFLDDGSIVESGPPDILEKPQTKRLEEFLNFVKWAR